MIIAISVAVATAVAWQFSGTDPQARERTALKVLAVSFFTLAAYVTVKLTRSLLGRSWADPIVTLVIDAVAVKEGREAWGGEHCC